MAYETLYRKYRPACFSDVVGQSHITTALKNQLAAGKTTHAYLFCGTRGTGKTSTARIFARALNCISPVDGEACGKCAACASSEGGSPDIIEIDAASNSRVEETRDLLERVRFSPIVGAKKVYIIDEVHMLSSSSFNALLKTLEEPPAHVVFILATTEPHKLLPTVLSRCQRYDFRRVSSTDLSTLISRILSGEGVNFDDDGLRSIALAAEGSARDALRLTEQCMAFCGDALGVHVNDVLGSSDKSFMFAIADCLIAGDCGGALRSVSKLIDMGRDLTTFVKDATRHFRDILMIRVCGDARSLVDCTDELYRLYQNQAAACSQERALRAIDLLTRCENDMRFLTGQRVPVEAALVRICLPDTEASVEAVMDRLSTIEDRLASGEFTQRQPAESQTAQKPESSAADDAAADDFPPWEEAPPPTDIDAPPDEAVLFGGTAAKTDELREAVLASSSPGIKNLLSRWTCRLDGNSFLFAVPGNTEKALAAGLASKLHEIEGRLSERFPNIKIRLEPYSDKGASTDVKLKAITNIFGDTELIKHDDNGGNTNG